jgi:solute carrier family 39 (zinc transporter), member 1/2/3
MLVYLVDEILHYCCGEAIQHGHSHGLSDEERQLILPENRQQQHAHNYQSYGTKNQETCEQHQHQHDIEDEIINQRICHTNHSEPCSQTFAGVIGMLTALIVHSIIEGMAIGIQDTSAEVMILFTAVLSHKFVVGFCLGAELSISATFKHHFSAIFVFSAGSVLGIAIGMGLVDLSAVESKVLAILQGVAGGTLLYVTVSEVLPREKARWHQNRINRAVGLTQFVAFAIGFAVMTVMNFYITEDD